jgi:hypothetical protein
MKLSDFAITLLLAAFAGSIGYISGELHPNDPKSMALEEMPPLEYFASPSSFSEVENVKTELDALCARYITIARSRGVRLDHPSGGHPAYEAGQAATIKQLERALPEFQGTDQQLIIVQDLLRALKRSSLYDRWIDVYLAALYEHPTQELIGHFDEEAVSIGQVAGRKSEVLAALKHVLSIPLEFAAKSSAQAALDRGKVEPRITLN